ncbi:hypothetical protein SAMN05216486_10294 [bacterium JGI 053]|nr:hypothetical protein SAMN05216486_10294 [bacterium JGI 053]
MELVQDASSAQQVTTTLKLIAHLPIIWPRESDCTRALADFSVLRLSHGLGLLDSLIAATAIGRGATLCSFNVKHYRAVRGLTLLTPYTR